MTEIIENSVEKRVTLDVVVSWKPCYNIKKLTKLAKGKLDISALEILDLPIPNEDKLWAVLRDDFFTQNELMLLIADFAERVLPLYEREYPNDSRPRDAINASRSFAHGEISAAARAAASAAARDAARDAARAAARDAAWSAASAAAWSAARAAVRDATRDATRAAARAAARAAVRDAARDAAWSAARDAARDAESNQQIEIVRVALLKKNEGGIA